MKECYKKLKRNDVMRYIHLGTAFALFNIIMYQVQESSMLSPLWGRFFHFAIFIIIFLWTNLQ